MPPKQRTRKLGLSNRVKSNIFRMMLRAADAGDTLATDAAHASLPGILV